MVRTAGIGNLAWLVDREIGRWAFLGLVAGVAGSLAVGLVEFTREALASLPTSVEATDVSAHRASQPAPTRATPPTGFATAYDALLGSPMTFTPAGAVLLAEGSFDAGSAARFAAAIKTQPEVTRISFNSPGGALDDAIAMARLIRERGLSTEVVDGAICASSCPLAFAGGLERKAGSKAAVAVHQFYTMSTTSTEPARAMAEAQMTAARISRHLGQMGVDPAAWLHALDTPPDQLYYFTSAEMTRYRLVSAPVATVSR